jgi:hypothetical protein
LGHPFAVSDELQLLAQEAARRLAVERRQGTDLTVEFLATAADRRAASATSTNQRRRLMRA